MHSILESSVFILLCLRMMPWPATGPMLYFFLVGRGRHFEQLSCSCPLLTEVPHPSASDIRALVVGSDFGGYATSFMSELGEFEHANL